MAQGAGRTARWRPPARLAPVPRRWRPWLQVGWALLTLVAFGSVVGGAWRGYVGQLEVAPRFTRVGLFSDADTDGRWTVGFVTPAVEAAGVRDGSTLLAVDGRALPPGSSEETASLMIEPRVAPPAHVTVTLRAPDGQVASHRLARTTVVAESAYVSDRMFFAVTAVGGVLGGLATLFVAGLLTRRRSDDPVSITLSVAFMALVTGLPVGAPLWEWLGVADVSTVANAVALVTFALAIPAFPDGRYDPRWGGWLAFAAVPVGALFLTELVPSEAKVAVALVSGMVIATTAYRRFAKTPQGIERQQLKWVAFGFMGSVVILLFGSAMLLLVDVRALPFGLRAWLQVLGWVLLQTGFLIMPVGVLVAIRRYRLWDADRVIGRSAGWAMLTLFAAAIWTGTTAILNSFVETTLGDNNKAVSAGLSTVIAVVVLGPVRDRVVAWTDRRFRSGLVALRALPRQLGVWQHGDTPEDIGTRVTHALAGMLRVADVAMLIHNKDGYACVGRVGVDAITMAAWLASHAADGRLPAGRVQRGDALFPLRLVLDDGEVPIGALLLGARADGSLYGKDELAELDTLEPELAATLRQAQRRQLHDGVLAGLVTALEGRLQVLEQALVPAARR